MSGEHILKAVDEELGRLRERIERMGGLAAGQLEASIQAVVAVDGAAAEGIVRDDEHIDTIEHEVDALVVRMLALRQPVASDLRMVIASLKIASDLERVGDHAKNNAKRVAALAQLPRIPAQGIDRMGRLVLAMLREVLTAYTERDVERATAVWQRDAQVDAVYNSVFRELLTYMMEDARTITACTHLLFVAKNLERVGDHATNIAEQVRFMITGTPETDERPRVETELPGTPY
jgi:phosphate transport system protein